MGTQVTPEDITNVSTSSGLAAVNRNFDTLADEFDSVLYRDGRQTLTGDMDVDSNRILNLPEAVNATEPIRKAEADQLFEDAQAALDMVESAGYNIVDFAYVCTVSGDGNVTLSGDQTVNGVDAPNGSRILLTDQTNAAENGIWIKNDGGAWTRATDFDETSEVLQNTLVAVRYGTNAGAVVLVTDNPITVGTTETEWRVRDFRDLAATLQQLLAADGATLIGYGSDTVDGALDDFYGRYIHVAAYGAVGDNVTDDYAAIASAVTAASTAGVPLIFDGTKTYKINQDTLTLPAGLNVKTNGCTFSFSKNQLSTAKMMVINGPCVIDKIVATVPTGILRQRGVEVTGNAVDIGFISVSSVDQQAQGATTDDFAVHVTTGNRIRIGTIAVDNFDRAVNVRLTNDSLIDRIFIEDYVRGLWVVDNTHLKINGGYARTRSINASQTAGHNGLITTSDTVDQEYVTISDFSSEDSGEHGIRIGGGPQKNISLVRPRVYNAQGCGIKALGTDNAVPLTAEFHQNLFIIDPLVEDCGTGGGASTNMCGLLIERTTGCQITNPIVRKRDLTYSCYYGILLYGVTDAIISNPIVRDCQLSGFYLPTEKSSAASADSTNIRIEGGVFTANGTTGLTFSSTDSKTVRSVAVTNVKSYGNTTVGIAIATATGGSFVSCFCSAHVYSNTVDSLTCNSTAWMLDCYGVDSFGSGSGSLSTITAANSSRWSNETSFYVNKAGTWTAL